jgi:hypothetical protein
MEATGDLFYPSGLMVKKGDQYHKDHVAVRTGGDYWQPVVDKANEK